MKSSNNQQQTLIFSFDGTGNEPNDIGKFAKDESISNILKLHLLMGGNIGENPALTKTTNGVEQKTFYYSGIGTRGRNARIFLLEIWYRLRQAINQAFAPTWGDARRIMNEASKDFEQANYVPNDTLIILGFSRGAALARKFASEVLKKQKDCTVSLLCVFDTVAAMNGIHREGERISSDVVFENGTLNPRIKRAIHIVAIDEDRVAFTPTLINRDEQHPDRIFEIWLPGVHSDIGGGYWRDGLSDVALEFMINEIKALGHDISIKDGDLGTISKLITSKQGKTPEKDRIEIDDVAINPLINAAAHRHTTLLSQHPRSIQVRINDRPSKNENDLPILHYSVKERFNKIIDYRPPALRGLKFKLFLKNGEISEPIHGITGLREYRMVE